MSVTYSRLTMQYRNSSPGSASSSTTSRRRGARALAGRANTRFGPDRLLGEQAGRFEGEHGEA